MSDLEIAGIRLRTHPDVYEPSDDTQLLLDCIEGPVAGRALDVGTGTGAAAIRLAQFGADAHAIDVNPAAVECARDNARRNEVRLALIEGDALHCIRFGRFDLVVCNPPYLPTLAHERLEGAVNRAYDAGPEGRDFLDPFLARIASDPPRRTMLLHSSLQGEFEPLARAHGLDARALGRKPLRFERLTVYDLPAARR